MLLFVRIEDGSFLFILNIMLLSAFGINIFGPLKRFEY